MLSKFVAVCFAALLCIAAGALVYTQSAPAAPTKQAASAPRPAWSRRRRRTRRRSRARMSAAPEAIAKDATIMDMTS